MKILTKNILTASLSLIFGIMLFNKSMFAAPPAATVSPTTITSGGTVNVTMFCTVAGNVIDEAYIDFLNPPDNESMMLVLPQI